jgi:hypothetical protein
LGFVGVFCRKNSVVMILFWLISNLIVAKYYKYHKIHNICAEKVKFAKHFSEKTDFFF